MAKLKTKTIVLALAVALSAAMMAALPLKADAIQPDAPFLQSQKKNKQKWTEEDKQIDQKLAALRKKFGKRNNVFRSFPKGWNANGVHINSK